jgi:hypothetical protein
MPAATNTAVMLVEQPRTTENDGTVASSFTPSQISLAMLLQPKLGMTVPPQHEVGSLVG